MVALQLFDPSEKRILHSFESVSLQDCVGSGTECKRLSSANKSVTRHVRECRRYFSDKAPFHLSGTVNEQNYRYRSDNNPEELINNHSIAPE